MKQRVVHLRIVLLMALALLLAFGSPSMAADAAESADAAGEGAISAECAEFAKDLNADLGKVIKAGCQPTLAQMSALMDTPPGQRGDAVHPVRPLFNGESDGG